MIPTYMPVHGCDISYVKVIAPTPPSPCANCHQDSPIELNANWIGVCAWCFHQRGEK